MKAVTFSRHGGPEVLEYTDVPDPSPKTGELLVRVQACSVNHLDLWIRQGMPAYRIALPHISGCDVAGVVEQLGSGVNGFKPGDAVVLAPGLSCGQCAWCRAGQDNRCVSYGIRGAATDGGYAELVTARASDALPLPEGLAVEAAAAFPLVFLTAWQPSPFIPMPPKPLSRTTQSRMIVRSVTLIPKAPEERMTRSCTTERGAWVMLIVVDPQSRSRPLCSRRSPLPAVAITP